MICILPSFTFRRPSLALSHLLSNLSSLSFTLDDQHHELTTSVFFLHAPAHHQSHPKNPTFFEIPPKPLGQHLKALRCKFPSPSFLDRGSPEFARSWNFKPGTRSSFYSAKKGRNHVKGTWLGEGERRNRIYASKR